MIACIARCEPPFIMIALVRHTMLAGYLLLGYQGEVWMVRRQRIEPCQCSRRYPIYVLGLGLGTVMSGVVVVALID